MELPRQWKATNPDERLPLHWQLFPRMHLPAQPMFTADLLCYLCELGLVLEIKPSPNRQVQIATIAGIALCLALQALAIGPHIISLLSICSTQLSSREWTKLNQHKSQPKCFQKKNIGFCRKTNCLHISPTGATAPLHLMSSTNSVQGSLAARSRMPLSKQK